MQSLEKEFHSEANLLRFMDDNQNKLSILMLPWLAHGHLSPFFELANKLLLNFQIYFCSTPINLKPIREILHGNNNKLSSSIQLIDIHIPSPPELPSHYHTTKDLPPHLMSTLKTAFDMAKPAFSNILDTLKPDVVIYHFLQPWVPEGAHDQNIPAILFCSCGAAFSSFCIHYTINPSKEFPFLEFFFPETEFQRITQFMPVIANGISNADRYLQCFKNSSNMVLIKTSSEVEAKQIVYLSQLVGKEMVPVGPLIQELANEDINDTTIINWLSKKKPSSVVFVSFGSEYFLSKEEMEEIADGLEHSKVNFIWVIRFPCVDKISIEEALPKGFIERVGDRGLVVEGWAPQVTILKHSSTGGFVSHCGWSSTLEGLMFGVPIIAIPMQLDQPLNAKLVNEIGVGIEVPRENGRLKREEVSRVINEVVLQEAGKEIRRRAKELSEKMREKTSEEIDIVVKKIVQIADSAPRKDI